VALFAVALYHLPPAEPVGRLCKENRAIILFDSAYEAYIREKDVPTAFMRLREQMRWQLSLEAFPRRQVLPEQGVRIP